MIVRMAKVEIVGPKEALLEVLGLVRERGVFQVEPGEGRGGTASAAHTASERNLLAEQLFYEELRRKIDELALCLPTLEPRQSYLDPRRALAAIAALVERHGALCREWCARRDELRREREELHRQTVFLDALAPLLEGVLADSALDFIGVTIKDPVAAAQLTAPLARLTGGSYEVVTAGAADGTAIALIALTRGDAEKVRHFLNAEGIPELSFPVQYRDLPLPEKIGRMRRRLAEVAAGLERVEGELRRFAQRWAPAYRLVREWLGDRLSLLTVTAASEETSMCFVMHGWIPLPELPGLRASLNASFAGRVLLEEKLVLAEELDRVPVAIRNPAYLRPFELFSRLLPLPLYTSYDPTPFIAVFFPIFFGLMLGDLGYALLLVAAALILRRRWAARQRLRDAATVLLVGSLYAAACGLLYGECFGLPLPAWLPLRELAVDRRHAVLPMLIFSVSVGAAHVLLGLLLAIPGELRHGRRREAAFKLVNVLILLGLGVLALGRFVQLPGPLTATANVALLALIPALLITGGILAPLEMLKNLGNAVSYARIMAIGLASVLVAEVANRFAGLTGDLLTGIVAAGLLHLVNLLLGVFSPTVHALRLHFVEFFGKFMDYGGRPFQPFRKPVEPLNPPSPGGRGRL